MTQKAIAKLNEKQLKYCETMSELIKRDRENGNSEQNAKDSGMLRGYLECLEQMDVITNIEMRGLYLFFKGSRH